VNSEFWSDKRITEVKKNNRFAIWSLVVAIVTISCVVLSITLDTSTPVDAMGDARVLLLGLLLVSAICVGLTAFLSLIGGNIELWVGRKLKELYEKKARDEKHPS